MQPKPKHLGPMYAEQFKDASIAEAYPHRPPYADEVIGLLLDLIVDEPRTVLDVGCGTGDLARRLASQVERVDAIDFSPAMLQKGKTLAGGDHPHLHWIEGRVEEARLQPPYALITAGESLHWMEWEVVLPLFRASLTPHGYLGIVGRQARHNPWDNELQRIIDRFSTNRDYQPYNLVEELEKRHLFQAQGRLLTAPSTFTQSIEDYIQSIHSRNGFSRERMGQTAAQAFDTQVRTMLTPFQQERQLQPSLICEVVWGKPR